MRSLKKKKKIIIIGTSFDVLSSFNFVKFVGNVNL